MTTPAELYACLYVREFPAQALLRLRPELRDRPCVVLEGEPPLQLVCSRNVRARSLGIVPGMTRVELDTFPDVMMLERSPTEEAAVTAVLLECAGNFSPRLETVADAGAFACVLDIVGTERLFGPGKKLAELLLQRTSDLGIHASVSVSGNFHTCVCMARGMPRRIVAIEPGQERQSLAGLPVAVLGLTEAFEEIFALWGIRTLGQLAELPEKDLVARLGQDGKRLVRLARGEHPHLFVPVTAVFALEERMELESPVELLDSLLFVLSMMIEQLIVRVSARALALASITITLKLEGGAAHERCVRPALPANDRGLWLKLIHLDLQAHPPSAAIVLVSLWAEPGPTSKIQLGLFSPQLPEPTRLDVTLARIQAIVGDDCVGTPALKDTHRSDGYRMEKFTVAEGNQEGQDAHAGAARLAARCLRPAETLAVMLRNQRPESFHFREKRYAVERAYGPWLSNGEWWSPTLWNDEQWDVVARAQDNARLCCCLVRNAMENSWQMVALYD